MKKQPKLQRTAPVTNCRRWPAPINEQSGGIIAKIAFILSLFAVTSIIALAALVTLSSNPPWLAGLSSLPHERQVLAAAEKYDLDPYLVFAIISAESGGQANACSPAGARGLMQLMPETAEWCARQMGLKNFTAEQLNDPAVNIDMGCWYLKHLYGEFNGNETAVITAYNAGLTNVQDWLAAGTWDGSSAHLDQIPYSETREYVRIVQENRTYFRGLWEQDKNAP